MSTTHVQTRLTTALVEAIDQRASAANITRAEALRGLLEAALAGTQVPDQDPLLVKIGETLGMLLARTDNLLEVSQSTRQLARAAYVTAHLHALTVLPAAQQEAFVAKVQGKLS
ncbi:hypothetical protein [Polymorphobacter megasporae]|uniref:hypothetical protein n=1 Tax=Glacieibacterium megasporae TaxID=2835787 RepID=UPI001C1E8A4D|nr:hypothetical protein [Polymorphobacter megasporae]UAJ10046.1 hypothetical protein KTC28_17505 [Polymorphobacter megasporae]